MKKDGGMARKKKEMERAGLLPCEMLQILLLTTVQQLIQSK